MNFPGPILEVGKITSGDKPQTGLSPKVLIIPVRTPTMRGEFIPIEIAETAARDLANKLSEYLDGPYQDPTSNDHDVDE